MTKERFLEIAALAEKSWPTNSERLSQRIERHIALREMVSLIEKILDEHRRYRKPQENILLDALISTVELR